VLCVALALYTVGVALASLDQLLGWLNTLMATVLSVFSAVVVGLIPFRFRTREIDRKKREELAVLLEAELAELERGLLDSRTVVPEEILEDRCPSAFHEIRLSIHHPHPLVIEEAARSGLAREHNGWQERHSQRGLEDPLEADHAADGGSRIRKLPTCRGPLRAARRPAEPPEGVPIKRRSTLPHGPAEGFKG